ncbi:hypothetical protein ACIOFV_16245 [Streptomyces mirabilis]|jgi:hypothetical protein|uniref:hypothetical protein n=1 Tax=Streptomyces mirabilis TaxID=68239 RepID=UPI003827A30D
MPHKPWFEFDPVERDDANRLGFLYEALLNHLHFNPVMDDFTAALNGALNAEFAHRAEGAYPPAGHGYPSADR